MSYKSLSWCTKYRLNTRTARHMFKLEDKAPKNEKTFKTYLNTVKLITVSSRPNMDIPHPIKVITFNGNGFEPLCSMSMSNAKFVKCEHSHLIVPESFPGSVLQPSFDQAENKS